jgi:hypothetical protein
MAPGRKSLRRVQLGLENPAGTAVSATTRLRIKDAVLKDQREVEEILEEVGILGGGADRTAVPKLFGAMDVPAQPMSFEQIQYFIAMSFGGPVTGSSDGVGSGKIYTTNIPTTAAPAVGVGGIRPYTVQGGDDFEVERMPYTVCNKFGLAGMGWETLKFNAGLFGRYVERLGGGFSAATVPDPIEDILVSKGRMYLDDVSGAYGTTQVALSILGIDTQFSIKLIPKPTLDGNLYFSYVIYTDHEIKGTVTFEHDTAADGSTGAKADWREQTPKLLRLDFAGNALATAGTTYSTKHLIIDLPVKWETVSELKDKEGNDIVTAEFRSRYNQTITNSGKIIVVTELASLP